jgi:hypothetical protein
MRPSTPTMKPLRAAAIAALLPLVLCLPDVSAGARLSEADQVGVLRAAGVATVVTRDELLGSTYYKDLVALLVARGVVEASIVDGTLVLVRLLCCRDDVEKSNSVYVYNPLAIQVAPGDIIEMRNGDAPSWNTAKGTLADLHSVTRVLQRAEEIAGKCWWEPRDERLWGRFVVCEWMPAEGWVEQKKKTNPAWYKPADPIGGR